MQAQRKYRLHWKQWLWGIPLGLLAIWQWTLFSNMIRQLFLGFLVMLAALPLMNFLEKRVSTGWAATLAMAGLSVGAGLFLLLLIPPLVGQARQIGSALPGLYRQVGEILEQAEAWLQRNGVAVDQRMRESLLETGEGLLSDTAGSLTKRLGGVAGGIGPLDAGSGIRLLSSAGSAARCRLAPCPLPPGRREMTVRIVRGNGPGKRGLSAGTTAGIAGGRRLYRAGASFYAACRRGCCWDC